MPDELLMESHGFSPDTLDLLRKRGHQIRFVESMGRVMAIQMGEDWLLGADDSRTEGLAAGF
jgi:gamma-glutamyltranspeptidase